MEKPKENGVRPSSGTTSLVVDPDLKGTLDAVTRAQFDRLHAAIVASVEGVTPGVRQGDVLTVRELSEERRRSGRSSVDPHAGMNPTLTERRGKDRGAC